MGPSRQRNLLVTILCVIIVSTFYLIDHRQCNTLDGSCAESPPPAKVTHVPREYTRTLVVASTQSEDTSWVEEELPHMQHVVYKADDEFARYHPPANKGHESMIYLTYIIDHYHNLSDTTIFTHSERNSWHNNDLFNFDLARMVERVSNEHVERVGYFNLRCHHESGCPDHINTRDQTISDKVEQPYFAEVWDALHGPEAPHMPEMLAVACCSQFAASKAAIRSIPLERWQHYQDWFLTTELDDSISGRIWEFTWHFIITGKDVLCPPIEQCYCDGFGICFKDEAQVMSWLAMKEVQAIAKHVKNGVTDERDQEDIQYHLDQRIGRPLNKWLYEAELRGKDPYTRALLSGRGDKWTEGDGL